MKTSIATKISKNSWATSATVYGDMVFPTNTKIAGGINNWKLQDLVVSVSVHEEGEGTTGYMVDQVTPK